MKKEAPFFSRVYALVETIPAGKVMTYGQISRLLDNTCSARYVGYAMASAPKGLPCHRVVNRLGEMAKGTMFGGATCQRKLLEKEGAIFKANGCLDLETCLYHS